MKHLLVYVYDKNGTTSVGNVDCYFKSNPPTMKEVRKAEQELMDNFGFDNVCVVNWILLSEE